MKYFKYLVTLVTAISILGSLSKDVKGFIRGFRPEIEDKEEIKVAVNETIVDKDDFSLTGIYEYTDMSSHKNSYLEFKEGYVYYYGNSSDFSTIKEKDSLSYFFTHVTDFSLEKNIIDFKVKVNNSMFYKYEISPLFRTEHNENSTIDLRFKEIDYRGVFSKDKDTILVKSKKEIPLFFVRKSL